MVAAKLPELVLDRAVSSLGLDVGDSSAGCRGLSLSEGPAALDRAVAEAPTLPPVRYFVPVRLPKGLRLSRGHRAAKPNENV